MYTGIRKKIISSSKYESICPDCKSENCLTIFATIKYHTGLILLPIFPTEKGGYTLCIKCIKTYDYENDMKSELRYAIEELQKKTKIPLWTYSGSVIIILLLIFIFIN